MTDPSWTFLTNHAHVLVCLADDPTIRLREVAQKVGITERAVQRIVAELRDDGYISVEKSGRRNQYVIHDDKPLRHSIESHCEISGLLDLILEGR